MDDLLVDINLDRAEICWETALRRVSGANLHSPSGCREWTNEQLINHLIGGGLRYEKLLAQCSPAEVEATRGQNHLGDRSLGSVLVTRTSIPTSRGGVRAYLGSGI